MNSILIIISQWTEISYRVRTEFNPQTADSGTVVKWLTAKFLKKKNILLFISTQSSYVKHCTQNHFSNCLLMTS